MHSRFCEKQKFAKPLTMNITTFGEIKHAVISKGYICQLQESSQIHQDIFVKFDKSGQNFPIRVSQHLTRQM